MSSTPSISVIVPVCRRAEQHLRRLLDSLSAQSVRELEILCVDDAAEADAAALLHAYAEQDTRIRLLRHATRRGCAAAYNTALPAARAPFVMFCGESAWYEPTFCEKMLAALRRADDVDMAVCGVQIHGVKRRRALRRYSRRYRRMQSGLVPGSPALALCDDTDLCNKVFRVSRILAPERRLPEGMTHHGGFIFFHLHIPYMRMAYIEAEPLCHRCLEPGAGALTAASAMGLLEAACHLWGYFCGRSSGLPGLWHAHGDRLWLRCVHSFTEFDKRGKLREQAAGLLRRFLAEQGCIQAGKLADIPAPLLEGLEQLFCGSALAQRLGLATRIRNYSEKCLRLFGLSLCRTKYDFDAITTSSFFGRLQVRERISPAAFYRFEQDDGPLLNALRPLGKFTFIPDQGNLGDALLATATLRFFDAHHLPYRMLGESSRPADVLVYGGGGIWTPDYEQEWLRILPLFRNAKRVVILPSSYRRCERLLEVADERFTLFCREMDSYDYLRSAGCRATVIPDHDMALRLTADFLNERRVKPPKQFLSNGIPRNFAHLSQRDVGYLLRSDCESAAHPYMPESVDLSACAGFSVRATRAELAFYARFMLCAVEYFGSIVTDRLHVGIAAALMGKPVYLLDNSYGKISAVYTHSLQRCPHVYMARQLPLSLPPAQPTPNAALFAEIRRHHCRTRELFLSRLGSILAPSCAAS